MPVPRPAESLVTVVGPPPAIEAVPDIPANEKSRCQCKAAGEHFSWLVNQIDGLPDKFRPFLTLEKRRRAPTAANPLRAQTPRLTRGLRRLAAGGRWIRAFGPYDGRHRGMRPERQVRIRLSPLEEKGFEPSVPSERGSGRAAPVQLRWSPEHCPGAFGGRGTTRRTRWDHWFESPLLQRRVRCEPS